MGNDTNSTAILLHLGKVLLNDFLAHLVLPLLGSIGKSLLLRLVPEERNV